MDLFANPSLLKSNRFETAIWTSKLVLMSMGILSTLVLLKVAVIPFAFNLVVSIFPRLWVSARTLLSPPFVYVIVNFIIITIVASSNFQHKSLPYSDSPPDDPNHTTISAGITEHDVLDTTHQPVPENQINNEPNEEKEEDDHDKDAEVKGSVLFAVDPSPEMNVSGESSPDYDDSLEGTWRTIMERHGKTVTPVLKKSDTWTATIRKAEPLLVQGDGKAEDAADDKGDDGGDPVAWAKKELRSETFNHSASLRRQKSMSPEELYKRAEAFIKNFNHQMRLQRMESYKRLRELVNGISG